MDIQPLDENRESLKTGPDLWIALVGACACFIGASVALSGWPRGVLPNLHHPFVYAGDALFQHWMTQRAIEGWVFQGSRSGFPFGSSFLDFPGSDAGNLLLLKALGLLGGDWVAADNLYLLLSFPFAFVAFYVVARRMAVGRKLSCACALLFAFLPYHFARILSGHFFYTWYGVVPLYLLAAQHVYDWPNTPSARKRRRFIRGALFLFFAASFGVYFALFGCLCILASAFARVLSTDGGKGHASARLAEGAGMAAVGWCAAIAAGVALNVAPNVWHLAKVGSNPEVAARFAVESEIYALKVTQLLAPQDAHRVPQMAGLGERYRREFPLSNTISYLGLFGIAGFATLIGILLRGVGGATCDARQRFLATLVLALLLVATVGGLNVLFALFVSPLIRGWDRISIFIACASLLSLAVALDMRARHARWAAVTVGALAAVITVVGLADQTVRPSVMQRFSSKEAFEADRAFYACIERSLPAGSPVYQLPYIPFPETLPLYQLESYDPLAGYLNTATLRWSAGGMKGRRADLFYRALSTLAPGEQLPVLRRLGFRGISLDRRGYADNGDAAIADWSRTIGSPPAISRADGQKVYFFLH